MADTLIHDIPTTATSFAGDDYIVLDGVTNGTRNMTQANLKNSVIAGNIAPLFNPNRTSSDAYAIGDDVIYDGEWYSFKATHYGAWDASHVNRNGSYSDYVNHLASASSFAATDVITVTNSTDGTRKMSKDDLLKLTAQNALADKVAPAFDPTRTSENPYKVGESVVHNGKTYTFKVDHYGAWADADVVEAPISPSKMPNIIQGQYSSSGYSTSSSRCCCIVYGINTSAIVTVSEGMSFRVGFMDSNNVKYVITSKGLEVSGVGPGISKWFKQIKLSDYAPVNVQQAYIIFKNDDGSNITPLAVYNNLWFSQSSPDVIPVYSEFGGITASAAEFTNDTTNLRSFVPSSVKFIRASKGYKFMLVAFDGTYWRLLTSTGWKRTGTSLFMDYVYLDEFRDQSIQKIFVVVKKEDGGEMVDSDIYKSLTMSYSSNDHINNNIYLNQGSVTVSNGNGTWNYSDPARLYARINTNFIKSISVSKDYSFRLVAVDNNNTYYVRNSVSWSIIGNSLFFKQCDLLDFLDDEFTAYYIVVKKDDDSNISPLDVNDAILVSGYSRHDSGQDESVSLDYNNFALAYDRHPIVTDSIPANIGIVCHKLDGDDGSLWYSDSSNGLKKLAVLISATKKPKDCMVAMSPSSNTLILTLRGTRGPMFVIKDGSTFNLFSDATTKPMGWLYNSGIEFTIDGNGVEHCVFAEYTGNLSFVGQELHVWHGTAPYTSESDWEIVMSRTKAYNLPDMSGTIAHFHQVRRDPWSDILYLTSGDYLKQLNWWYSTDCGQTWNLLISDAQQDYPWEDHVLRIINFVFTKDWIYFATDHGENHSLSKIARNQNGLIDISTRVKLCDLPEGHATNSICLNQYPYGIFMYDRIDTGYPAHYTDKVKMQFYDIESNTLTDVVDIPLVSPQWGGSRGKCYLEYTSLRFPHPMMGFSDDTRCLFDIAAPNPSKLGTIVYNVATKEVTDLQA